jgi:hypothetical protein
MAQQWLSASDPFFAQFSNTADEGGYVSGPYDSTVAGLQSVSNWQAIAPQLGWTGPTTIQGYDGDGYNVEYVSPDFLQWIESKKAEGYDFVTDASKINKDKQTIGLRTPTGEVIGQRAVNVSGFGDFFKEFVLPSVGAYFGGQALGNALIPLENALTGAGGIGGVGGAAFADLAGGMLPEFGSSAAYSAGLQGAGAGALTAGNLTNLPTNIMGGGADVVGAGGTMTGADLAVAAPDASIGIPGAELGEGIASGVPAWDRAASAAGLGLNIPPGAISSAGSAGPTGIELVDKALDLIKTPAGQAVLGGVGSAVGGVLEANAAEQAAETQSQAAQNALALQREMFEYQKSLLEPYRTAGTKALERLSGAMGLGGPGSQQQMLEMDPGYGFRLGEGLKALERMQASRGNFLSGGALKAGQRFAQDTASQEYGNAYNRLANIAGLGQTAGTQMGGAAAGFGTSAGNIMGQEANALAAGRMGRASAYTGAIGGALGSYQNYLNRQQEERLIRDIFRRPIGG